MSEDLRDATCNCILVCSADALCSMPLPDSMVAQTRMFSRGSRYLSLIHGVSQSRTGTTPTPASAPIMTIDPSARVYSRFNLRMYDLVVLVVSNPLAWLCPTASVLLPLFHTKLGAQAHLDVGAGTGYYPAKSVQHFAEMGNVTLLDLNAATLTHLVLSYPTPSKVARFSLACAVRQRTLIHATARTTRPYHSGPRGWPVIGNLLQIPQVGPWLVYSAWADKLGDVVHPSALSDHLVILTTAQAAKDLLDGRSTMYSDRQSSTMADLSGIGIELPMLSYNEQWRKQRKIVAQSFNASMVLRYRAIQGHEARVLALGILQRPETLVSQTKTRIAAIIMRVTYGYTVTGKDDPMITVPFALMDNFGSSMEPGTWMVDFIPQRDARWTRGVSFLRIADELNALEHKASWAPYLWCKQRPGLRKIRLVATALSEAGGQLGAEDEASLLWVASSGLGGGLETNMSTIFTFFVAMMRRPDVQARAQEEIARVVGMDRLPMIADRPSPRYVRSVIAEVFRWYPAAP
ncbi:hypothetical protein FOMPIDRAFT_1063274 [Fomitopsis schrenkii]|uniref:Cytochrome P450 n=1 Tax=Fomitopsis schrenkii TaxID=2126942 RepID=S8DSS1_FOMSC|nr:hypothetical protein FOMPIDRAFT_1063274 [Fomitopsis schrenkii]